MENMEIHTRKKQALDQLSARIVQLVTENRGLQSRIEELELALTEWEKDIIALVEESSA